MLQTRQEEGRRVRACWCLRGERMENETRVSETRRPKIRITYVPKSAGGGGEEASSRRKGLLTRETIDELLFNSAGVKTAIHNR